MNINDIVSLAVILGMGGTAWYAIKQKMTLHDIFMGGDTHSKISKLEMFAAISTISEVVYLAMKATDAGRPAGSAWLSYGVAGIIEIYLAFLLSAFVGEKVEDGKVTPTEVIGILFMYAFSLLWTYVIYILYLAVQDVITFAIIPQESALDTLLIWKSLQIGSGGQSFFEPVGALLIFSTQFFNLIIISLTWKLAAEVRAGNAGNVGASPKDRAKGLISRIRKATNADDPGDDHGDEDDDEEEEEEDDVSSIQSIKDRLGNLGVVTDKSSDIDDVKDQLIRMLNKFLSKPEREGMFTKDAVDLDDYSGSDTMLRHIHAYAIKGYKKVSENTELSREKKKEKIATIMTYCLKRFNVYEVEGN